ncbi:MAG: twin-arginine translocation signal domain-containing protein [Proteobacteria bacterium]|nr:twin-arginine translocation signal domain-containing protein [Pseudomonadota bacterium]MBU1736690.1 twin-arginine translocation signal domain-containing protein [Pseudomonadota bacterium]
MTKQSDKYLTGAGTAHDEVAENPSRRKFLNTAGIAAVGGLVTAVGTNLLDSGEAKAAPAPEAPPLPWKYTKLDPLEAGKRGYKSYLAQGG